MRLNSGLYMAVLLFSLNLQGFTQDRKCFSGDQSFNFMAAKDQYILSASLVLFKHIAFKQTQHQSIPQLLPKAFKQFKRDMFTKESPELKKKAKAFYILKTGYPVRWPTGTVMIYPFNYFW